MAAPHTGCPQRRHRRWPALGGATAAGAAALLLLMLLLMLGGCGTLGGGTAAGDAVADADAGPDTSPDRRSDAQSAAEFIIVAVNDTPEPTAGAGSTPRADYPRAAGYAGSARSGALAAALAREHGLAEQAAWTIDPLRLRCMLYRMPPGADRAALLARLNADPRVQLAQPLNQFETLATPASTGAGPGAGADYNDPYIGLQRGFAAIGTAQAQKWSRGDGVRVAIIDTGVDAGHPDLEGRVGTRRDFVGALGGGAQRALERHGTEVAGVIAAGANNGMGIAGMAPRARLLSYRACWAVVQPAGTSRCDSFTLAQALGAVIAAGADVVNLSLGGPADPLLHRLTAYAMVHGAIVVGAVPPGGRLDGFPLGVPGVIAVAAAEDALPTLPASRAVLMAPGRDILTLAPGGNYDFASGSSLAAAHVSGAVALLRALSPSLSGAAALALLQGGSASQAAIDVCAAVRQLRPAAECAPPAALR